ncbi:hypothetical protein LJC15_02210 [Desulfovibrio sp. OttesenSCG-928-G11]|nr:hypothetical protein [Desulfovibrio sp. OttesenSCG-928-G11]
MTYPAQAALAALTDGLPPHADPLDCDDMRGPRSFFGEHAIMPKPVAALTPDKSRAGSACQDSLQQKAFHQGSARPGLSPLLAGGCATLWLCPEGLSPLERARRISGAGLQFRLPEPEDDRPRGLRLDVPAATYLTGRASSSFAVAWKLFEDGLLPEWGAVLSSCQSEGRGRLRRPWHSPRGNLHVTFRLPADPLFQGDSASLITGLMLLRAFLALGFSLRLKWPNDLLLDDRCKVGGILLEEKNGVLLAGLGVNLAEAPEAGQLRQAAAVRGALLLPHGETVPGGGGPYEHLPPFPLWRQLVSEAILAYEFRIRDREKAELMAELGGFLAWKQRLVRFGDEDAADAVRGVFLGLGPEGGALLRLAGGERELFSGSLALATGEI